jgi:hypothetical protein
MSNKWRSYRILWSRSGQSTVEYALVSLVLLAIIIALAIIATRLSEGLFVEHAMASASHSFTENSSGFLGDVVLY